VTGTGSRRRFKSLGYVTPPGKGQRSKPQLRRPWRLQVQKLMAESESRSYTVN
jgi:hypothetical protein